MLKIEGGADKLHPVSTLIPVHASEHILGGVSENLATAFSLANPETSSALKAFLEDTERGMFHGPYVRARAVAVCAGARVGRNSGLGAVVVHAVSPPGGSVPSFAEQG